MKLSKGHYLSHIMQGIIPVNIHNATFGTFVINFPMRIIGIFNLFQILYLA